MIALTFLIQPSFFHNHIQKVLLNVSYTELFAVCNVVTLMHNRTLGMTLKFTKWPVLVVQHVFHNFIAQYIVCVIVMFEHNSS